MMTVYEQQAAKAERKRKAAILYKLANLLDNYRPDDREFMRQLRDAERRASTEFALPDHVRETLTMLNDLHDTALRATGLPSLSAENPWPILLERCDSLYEDKARLERTLSQFTQDSAKTSLRHEAIVAEKSAEIARKSAEIERLTQELADAKARIPKTFRSIKKIA